jgi:hypothetical protein
MSDSKPGTISIWTTASEDGVVVTEKTLEKIEVALQLAKELCEHHEADKLEAAGEETIEVKAYKAVKIALGEVDG